MVPLRCLIVDDDAVLLEAFRSLLEGDDLSIVGTAADAAEALRCAEDLRPDVILLDVGVGGESGFDLAQRLVDQAPGEPPTLILISAHSEDDCAELVDDSPAVGFVAKDGLSAAAVMELVQPR